MSVPDAADTADAASAADVAVNTGVDEVAAEATGGFVVDMATASGGWEPRGLG